MSRCIISVKPLSFGYKYRIYRRSRVMRLKLFLVLSLLTTSVLPLFAQSIKDFSWVFSAGLGVGEAEATTGMGLTSGAYIGYRVNVFEVGVGVHHLSQADLFSKGRVGVTLDVNREQPNSLSLTKLNDRLTEFAASSSYSLGLVAGVDPLGLIKNNHRHRLLLAVTAGVGASNRASYYWADSRYGVAVQHRGSWSLGGKG